MISLLHGFCFPPSTALSENMFESYGTLKVIFVGGSVTGLINDFAVDAFLINCLWQRELTKWSVSSLKIIDMAFFPPADSISSCNLLLAVTTEVGPSRCLSDCLIKVV